MDDTGRIPTSLGPLDPKLGRPGEARTTAKRENTGHSPTAWRTGHIDPSLPFPVGTRHGRNERMSGPSRPLKKSDFVLPSTLDARTVLNPNGNKRESKRPFDVPKNDFQQPASRLS